MENGMETRRDRTDKRNFGVRVEGAYRTRQMRPHLRLRAYTLDEPGGSLVGELTLRPFPELPRWPHGLK
eukprot:6184335-Pleurochrysis_carterae.AAC.3